MSLIMNALKFYLNSPARPINSISRPGLPSCNIIFIEKIKLHITI